MKIYINHFDGSKLNIEYDSSHTTSFIYSKDGIYKFKNNKLYNIELIHDNPCDVVTYKGYEFLIDTSTYVSKESIYHIPFDHIFCEETIFKKNMGEGIIFTKRVFFDQVSYYFEIEGKLESFMFSKMFTFII